jgi:hypothetical protein
MTLIRNRGTAGDVLNGTNTGLVKVEGPAIWYPGNHAATQSGLTPVVAVGGIGIAVKVRPTTWNATTVRGIANQYNTSNKRAWRLGINTAGSLQYHWSSDGVDTGNFSSPGIGGSIGALDGEAWWLGMTHDTATPLIRFWVGGKGDVPVWIQLGADYTPTVQPGELLQSVDVEFGIGVGYNGYSNLWDGSIEAVYQYSGVGGNTAPNQGALVFALTPADIAATAPASPSITPSVGPVLDFDRSTSGPVTTLVPAGKTVLINPETGGSAVRINWAVEGYQPLSGNDLVHGYLFNRGNVPSVQTNVFAGGGFNPYFGSGSPPSSLFVSVLGITLGAGSTSLQLPVDPFEPCVVFVVLNHDTNLLKGYCYDKTGEVGNTGGRAFTGEAAGNDGFFMRSVPGSFGCGFYREGVGIAAEYDDTALAALAAYLLNKDI